MLIVEVHYTCKPGRRAEVLELAKPNVVGTRQEKGNLAYTHFASPDDENEVFVFEKWESVEAFQKHPTMEHHRVFSAARKPLLEPGKFFITIYNSEENEELTRFIRETLVKSIS